MLNLVVSQQGRRLGCLGNGLLINMFLLIASHYFLFNAFAHIRIQLIYRQLDNKVIGTSSTSGFVLLSFSPKFDLYHFLGYGLISSSLYIVRNDLRYIHIHVQHRPLPGADGGGNVPNRFSQSCILKHLARKICGQGKIPQTAAKCRNLLSNSLKMPDNCRGMSVKLPNNDGKLLKCSNCYKIGHLLALNDFFTPLV